MNTYRLTAPLYVEADTLTEALDLAADGEGDAGPLGFDRLAAAVEAVRTLHLYEPRRSAEGDLICDECRQVWPCRTRLALSAALDSDPQ
jgi:hypothetical protein